MDSFFEPLLCFTEIRMNPSNNLSVRFKWFHWMILSFSIGITFFGWWFSSNQIEEKIQYHFNRESDQTIELIIDRMQKYEDALWSGVAAIEAYGSKVSQKQWRIFTEKLNIESKYPGINGIAVIDYVHHHEFQTYLQKQKKIRPGFIVRPDHNEKEHFIVSYIEPFKENARAIGLDLSHEKNRYITAKKVRDTGLAQITGPIALVQESEPTPGFLFFVPYYRGGPYETIEERQKHLVGMVNAPFVVKKLLQEVTFSKERKVSLQIIDEDALIYNENLQLNPDFDPNPLLKTIKILDFYGRKWVFNIQTTKSFREISKNNQPLIILVSGLVINFLIVFLILSLLKTNERAVGYASKMNEELNAKSFRLEETNKELEQFAYIVSHDLKAPLRHIKNLSEWIEEDLGDSIEKDTAKKMSQLRTQGSRMSNMIHGILEYSSSIRGKPELVECNLEEIIEDVIDSILIPEDYTVQVDSNMPKIFADKIKINQVFSNLISNSIKHHKGSNGIVKVSAGECKKNKKFIEILVADNGPGIKPAYSERAFKVFEVLESTKSVENTGVGLAIVKKLVESQGGKVFIMKKEDPGATFQILWPKNPKV
jgi:signal transduction histidine kinase